jgi:hypothetical protein
MGRPWDEPAEMDDDFVLQTARVDSTFGTMTIAVGVINIISSSAAGALAEQAPLALGKWQVPTQ